MTRHDSYQWRNLPTIISKMPARVIPCLSSIVAMTLKFSMKINVIHAPDLFQLINWVQN